MERIEADITHNASERIDATVVKIAIALIITSFSVLHAAEATVNIQLSIIMPQLFGSNPYFARKIYVKLFKRLTSS